MSNRTTVKSNIDTLNVPSVSNAIMGQMLKDNICDNVRFIEDVATVQSSIVSNITCDFTGKDRIDLSRFGGTLNITLAGIGDGATKFIMISKTAGQPVTFTGGVVDITPVSADVDDAVRVLYEIVRKDIYYFAKAWLTVGDASSTRRGLLETATAAESNALSVTNKIVTPGTIPQASDTQKGVTERATVAECNALSDTERFVTPGRLPNASTSQKGIVELATQAETSAGSSSSLAVTPSGLQPTAWLTATGLQAGWSGTINYFRDAVGNVHMRSNNLAKSSNITGFSSDPIWLVPSGYKPDATCVFLITSTNGSTVVSLHRLAIIDSGGGAYYLYFQPEPDDYASNYSIQFYIIFRAA